MPTLIEQINLIERKIKWYESFDMQHDKLHATKYEWLKSERNRLLNSLAQQHMQCHPWSNNT